MQKQFQLPVLDHAEGDYTIYDLPEAELAPGFFVHAELEAFEDGGCEVHLKLDKEGVDLRDHIGAAPTAISDALWSVGIQPDQIEKRESGAMQPDCISFTLDLEEVTA